VVPVDLETRIDPEENLPSAFRLKVASGDLGKLIHTWFRERDWHTGLRMCKSSHKKTLYPVVHEYHLYPPNTPENPEQHNTINYNHIRVAYAYSCKGFSSVSATELRAGTATPLTIFP
jgi:hypothetical protein